MRGRIYSWLAWSLAGLALAMAVASAVLSILAQSVHVPSSRGAATIVSDLLIFVSFLAFPIVGALIASKHPRNPIGWICLTAGLFWMLIILSESYSAYGLARPGSVPALVTSHALLYAWLWVPTVGLIGIYLILLFPDGQLPSRRWRPLAWLSGMVIVVVSVATFLTPGPLDGLGGARNPFGLEEQPWVADAGSIVLPLLPLCMLASAVSLVLRFRRSRGEVREQIKWIAFAALFVGLVYLALMIASTIDRLISTGTQGDLGAGSLWGALLETVMLLSFAGVPISMGFAILRYRLYEIDLLINRTLVYGVLTATLALIYVGGVATVQAIFRALTGQEQQPQLAVVVSTLVIAALFNPLRRRIQSFIDRRFYRRKYDAAKTLEAFSAKLREQTDLEDLAGDLLSVVRNTVRPEHAGLWLRPLEYPTEDRR